MSFSFLTSLTGEYLGHSGNLINGLASGIKNNASNGSEASGVEIKFAGVSGSGFLSSYGLGVAANSVSSSSASLLFLGRETNSHFRGDWRLLTVRLSMKPSWLPGLVMRVIQI